MLASQARVHLALSLSRAWKLPNFCFSFAYLKTEKYKQVSQNQRFTYWIRDWKNTYNHIPPKHGIHIFKCGLKRSIAAIFKVMTVHSRLRTTRIFNTDILFSHSFCFFFHRGHHFDIKQKCSYRFVLIVSSNVVLIS